MAATEPARLSTLLHTIWTDARLHLWGVRREHLFAGDLAQTVRSPKDSHPDHPCALTYDELRGIAGDLWDSLLISGGVETHLTLQLPVFSGSNAASDEMQDPSFAEGAQLHSFRLPTLAFAPADAMDVLAGSVQAAPEGVGTGASLRFWSKVADLVLELLAKQAFVPAVHSAGSARYQGYWRVVVNDARTSERLRHLIVSMPGVCRSLVGGEQPVQATALLESFLWSAVDTLVRRCLEGDELAHAIQDHGMESSTREMRWLQSLVRSDATLEGSEHDCASVHHSVRNWITSLEPPPAERASRTCFRLHPPAIDTQPTDDADQRQWKLTLHVQATSDPELIVDAVDLSGDQSDVPAILRRPFDNALQQLRGDVTDAARHFPPLKACGEPEGPLECSLSLAEAYTFLRDTAPILELEGFGVWLPGWWQDKSPRPRMRLGLRPVDGSSTSDPASMRLDAIVAYDWHVAVGDDELSLEEISELARAKEPLVRVRGRWTEVQPSDVSTALAFLEKGRTGTMTLFEALRQCYMADELETGLPVAGLRADGWINTLLGASDFDAHVEEFPPPKAFIGTLRPYQLKGVQWLSFLSRLGLGACLADDMGLGKTIQMIALWLHERENEENPGPTLLVVPMSLVGNWHREIERFGPTLKVMIHHGLERLSGLRFVQEVAKHDVVISTYALTHRDLEHLTAIEWHRIVLDEAQNIKNPAAKQSVAIRSLKANQRVALTGTPVENRLSELWSIMDFLNKGYLSNANDFRRRFAVPIERHHDADRASRLRHLLRPFILRRLKSDPSIQVDLPAKMEMKVFCNLTREQAALYEATVSDMLGQIDHSDGIQRRGLILATLVKLKQICNHPVQFLADGGELPHRSGKCDRLTEMIEEVLAEGDRALIFTQYRRMGDLLKKALETSSNREVLFLHGGTPRRDRDAMVERFQNGTGDTPIFILSLKAGGFGLNLTAANHVFHYDRWWNPAVEDQATDRAHRIGQDKQVQVHKFVCIGTLEERIDAILEAKRRLADQVIGSGESWLTELSTDALRDLFTLSREAVAED